MKKQQELTIGETNIVCLKFPKFRISKIKKWGKSYSNTINKAIAGKKLTYNQAQQLLSVHLLAKDFPNVPKLIILQLIEAYNEKLDNCIYNEHYENAIEFRDIIISLKELYQTTKINE